MDTTRQVVTALVRAGRRDLARTVAKTSHEGFWARAAKQVQSQSRGGLKAQVAAPKGLSGVHALVVQGKTPGGKLFRMRLSLVDDHVVGVVEKPSGARTYRYPVGKLTLETLAAVPIFYWSRGMDQDRVGQVLPRGNPPGV